MKLAIASGKGGTGKTTLAVNLALAADGPALLADCDVEEPNDHLFFAGLDWQQHIVTSPIPVVDESRCDGCGACSRFCQFNAIVSFGVAPYVSPELCHGCGGCRLVCPRKAISETQQRIGVVETAQAGDIALVQGRLDVGGTLAPTLIRAVQQESADAGLAILDAPPGTSCPVVTTLRGADYVLLVTEPTPFGLNDLAMAVEVVRQLGLPHGVVINRADIGDDRVARSAATTASPSWPRSLTTAGSPRPIQGRGAHRRASRISRNVRAHPASGERMKELVVISGKGGTGKTSVLASLAVLADNAVLADCDVDAADLHLVLSPEVREEHDFWSGHEAVIRAEDCMGCGLCRQHCRFGAIALERTATGGIFCRVDPAACEGCGVCAQICPYQAVDFPERLSGRWMLSDTRAGTDGACPPRHRRRQFRQAGFDGSEGSPAGR